MTKKDIERYTLGAAGVVIVALTISGFWLSYAHLAEVAGQHGLRSSPTRRWAWPATLDAFIVAGELLMLRAGLRRVTDRWAIALTATGSVGSIALNVAGVNGTGSAGTVPLLDYVVAAVPPTAALLAFGVLMRQIHQFVDQPAGHPEPAPAPVPEPPVTAPATLAEPPPDPAHPVTPTAVSAQPTNPPSEVAESRPRGDRSHSAAPSCETARLPHLSWSTARDARPAPPQRHSRRADTADEVPYADEPSAARVRTGGLRRSQ